MGIMLKSPLTEPWTWNWRSNPVVLCAGAVPGAWHFCLTLNSYRNIQCQFSTDHTTEVSLSPLFCSLQCLICTKFTHCIVDRMWGMGPLFLNIFLPFSVVSSLPVEIFIDPPQLTLLPPLACPSGQWFCPNDRAVQYNGGEGQISEEIEKGACISEHTSCNGRCPTPALWWANPTALVEPWQWTGVTSQVNVYQRAPSAGSYLVVEIIT